MGRKAPDSEAPPATIRAREETTRMTEKPILYITRDTDGIFLWFSVFKPVWHQRNQRFCAVADRIRLPVSWYNGLIGIGEMRSVDPEMIFNRG